MRKAVRKHRLVGRLFLTLELKPTAPSAATPGCLHEIEIENTTTILHDVTVFSNVVDGIPSAPGQNIAEIQHHFAGVLDEKVRTSRAIGWTDTDPKSIRIHTHKLSCRRDDDPDWADDLIDPIVELSGKA